MADIEFNCPACDQVLEAPEEMTGEAIDCPSCETEITIPPPAGDPISVISTLRSRKIAIRNLLAMFAPNAMPLWLRAQYSACNADFI